MMSRLPTPQQHHQHNIRHCQISCQWHLRHWHRHKQHCQDRHHLRGILVHQRHHWDKRMGLQGREVQEGLGASGWGHRGEGIASSEYRNFIYLLPCHPLNCETSTFGLWDSRSLVSLTKDWYKHSTVEVYTLHTLLQTQTHVINPDHLCRKCGHICFCSLLYMSYWGPANKIHFFCYKIWRKVLPNSRTVSVVVKMQKKLVKVTISTSHTS